MAAHPPLPDDPVLAAAAAGLERVGFVGEIWDAQWRLAYLSAEYATLSELPTASEKARRDAPAPAVCEI